jgi:hypothetical protein
MYAEGATMFDPATDADCVLRRRAPTGDESAMAVLPS